MQTYNDYLNSIGEYGVVEEVHYPLVRASGLPQVKAHEIIIFESGLYGEVFSLDKDRVDILVFSKEPIQVGTKLVRTDTFFSVAVGNELLGCIIDPLGSFIYSAGTYSKPTEQREVDQPIKIIAERVRVHEPFLTGVGVVDTMIPLGKGQKELVIGDRKTGKTAFILTAIRKQMAEGTIIVYAAIGRKKSDIKKLQDYFEKEGMLQNMVFIASTPHDPPAIIYVAPYSAMTIAEYFRDQGKNVLLILDDLSTHAKFYREISLVARRFPGRESYPGDIFHTHSKLIERAGNFKHAEKGEVSITCLPVVEIVEGDLAGYIATNIMGMTDGHIYFDSNVYYKGRRPAINLALSVTRVGRQAQNVLNREINQILTAFLAEYEKIENLSHFGAELSAEITASLKKGEKVYEFFNQHYKDILPEPVKLTLIGMIWDNHFNDISHEALHTSKTQLMNAHKIEQNKTFLHQLTNVKTFAELQKNISQHKDTLLKLCNIKTS